MIYIYIYVSIRESIRVFFCLQYRPPLIHNPSQSLASKLFLARQLPSLAIQHGKISTKKMRGFSIAMLDYQGLRIECPPSNTAKPMLSLSWRPAKALRLQQQVWRSVRWDRSPSFFVVGDVLGRVFLLKSMNIDSIVFSRFTWIEKSKYIWFLTFFHDESLWIRPMQDMAIVCHCCHASMIILIHIEKNTTHRRGFSNSPHQPSR